MICFAVATVRARHYSAPDRKAAMAACSAKKHVRVLEWEERRGEAHNFVISDEDGEWTSGVTLDVVTMLLA